MIKAMKRFILFSLFVIVSIMTGFTQVLLEENAEIVGDLHETFSKLSPSHITFGALRDRAVELVDFDLYDGSHPDEYSTRDSYLYLLKSARTLYSDIPSWQAESVLYDQEELNSLSQCAVSVLLFNFMYIKENALRDSLITYDGEYMYDAYDEDGVWKNPYNEGCLFAMAPSDTLFSNSVTFTFCSNSIVQE